MTTCRSHNHQSSFNKNHTMGASSEAGTVYLSGTPEFNPVFSEVFVVQYLVFCAVSCLSSSSFS